MDQKGLQSYVSRYLRQVSHDLGVGEGGGGWGERIGEGRQFSIFNLATAFIPSDNGEGKIEVRGAQERKQIIFCLLCFHYLLKPN